MAASLIRTFSFFSKWFAELVREPMLMVSLVLGPFLVLLLFGVGAQIGNVPRPRAIIVQPATSQAEALGPKPEDVSQYLTIVDTTQDRQAALDALRRGVADLAVVLPSNPERTIAQGERARLEIITAEIDPLRDSYARVFLQYQIAALNQGMLERAIGGAQASAPEIQRAVTQARQSIAPLRQAPADIAATRRDLAALKAVIAPAASAANQALALVDGVTGSAEVGPAAALRPLADNLNEANQSVDRLDRRLAEVGQSGLPSAAELDQLEQQLTTAEQAANQLATVPAAVLAAPFELQLVSAAPFALSTLAYYAPAVLALLLQHLAVTLGALSLARIRLLGLMELLQTSPVRPSEVVVGNYLSYGTLCLLAGSALVALLIFALQVPLLGSLAAFVGVLALLVFASLGIGFVIALLAPSEQQAAQLAMLVLIASTFFSGFLIFLESIQWPAQALSYLLPATYAIRTLRDIMLRGVTMTPLDFAALGIMGGALFLLTLTLFRREFRPR